MKKLLTRKALGIVGALIVLLGVGVAIAQPTIAEMKLQFYDTYVKLSYDANPSNRTLAEVLEVDGNDAVVTVSGDLEVTGSVRATYLETFGEAVADAGLTVIQHDGTVYDGTAGAINDIYTGDGNMFLWFPIVGQTLLPVMSATGLNIGADQVDNDGAEIFAGVMGASGRQFIVGTDPAVKFCAAVTIADVSGTDEFHVGWRRPNAPANGAAIARATFDDYTDLASIGIVTAASPAAIQIETILNNAATTTTDTTNTVADGVSKRYCVLVSAAGVVTYTNDGAAPTTTAAFTFDDGDPIIPFIHYLHATTTPGAITITEWEVAYTSAGVNP